MYCFAATLSGDFLALSKLSSILHTQYDYKDEFPNLKVYIFSWILEFCDTLLVSVSDDSGGTSNINFYQVLAHSVEKEKVGREFCHCDITWLIQVQMSQGLVMEVERKVHSTNIPILPEQMVPRTITTACPRSTLNIWKGKMGDEDSLNLPLWSFFRIQRAFT